jgi:hypothetical protein
VIWIYYACIAAMLIFVGYLWGFHKRLTVYEAEIEKLKADVKFHADIAQGYRDRGGLETHRGPYKGALE